MFQKKGFTMDSNINNLRIKDIIKDTNLSLSDLSADERALYTEINASYLTHSDISYISNELIETRNAEKLYNVGLEKNCKKHFLQRLHIFEELIEKTPNYTLEEYANRRAYSKFYDSITSRFSSFNFKYRLFEMPGVDPQIKKIATYTFITTLITVIFILCIFFYRYIYIDYSTTQGRAILYKILIIIISLLLMFINLIHLINKK